jgi:two-component system OmpR family response regulator/two-component system response regulator RstA
VDGARILLVEDDERLAQLVADALSRAGWQVTHCARGDEGEARMRREPYDVVLLDGHLPGKDGFDVLRDVRRDFAGRIVMLTARDDDIDQVLGLEGGADDYIAKPVAPRVLLARLKALMRREAPAAQAAQGTAQARSSAGAASEPPPMRFGNLEIRPAAREVRVGSTVMALTTAEYELLLFLASRAGLVVSRDDIMQGLRGLEFDGLDRAIDARVSRLRRKIGDDAETPSRLKTVRGQGYLFVPGGTSAARSCGWPRAWRWRCCCWRWWCRRSCRWRSATSPTTTCAASWPARWSSCARTWPRCLHPRVLSACASSTSASPTPWRWPTRRTSMHASARSWPPVRCSSTA